MGDANDSVESHDLYSNHGAIVGILLAQTDNLANGHAQEETQELKGNKE